MHVEWRNEREGCPTFRVSPHPPFYWQVVFHTVENQKVGNLSRKLRGKKYSHGRNPVERAANT